MRRLNQLLLVVLFLVLITLPLAANLRGIDGADQEAENRTLAAWPTLDGSWQSISGFGPGLAAWFEDHFGFRSRLVKWYGESRYFGLGVSPSVDVLVGKDGWLYYSDDGGLQDFVSNEPLPPEQITNWRHAVAKARDWCAKHGIVYQFTVPPDKSETYPDYFPDTVHRIGAQTRSDEVLNATQDLGVVVDVRPALNLMKDKERLYHRTDTHWNQRGAFIAYQQMIRALHDRLPAIPPPLERSDFEDASRDVPGMDLAGMIGLTRVLREQDLRLTPKQKRRYVVIEPAGGYATAGEGRIVTEIPGSTLPRAVMFRDSYTSWLAPFLSEHFSRIVYLWQYDFDADIVLKEKADVVIQEIVGRHLYEYIPSPELIPDP